MILVTALNGKPFYLNPTLIYRIEEMPDTLITLTDGKTLVVAEAAQEVAQRVIEYHTVIHSNQVKT